MIKPSATKETMNQELEADPKITLHCNEYEESQETPVPSCSTC